MDCVEFNSYDSFDFWLVCFFMFDFTVPSHKRSIKGPYVTALPQPHQWHGTSPQHPMWHATPFWGIVRDKVSFQWWLPPDPLTLPHLNHNKTTVQHWKVCQEKIQKWLPFPNRINRLGSRLFKTRDILMLCCYLPINTLETDAVLHSE